MEKLPETTKLTPRQAQAVALVASGHTHIVAARAAGYRSRVSVTKFLKTSRGRAALDTAVDHIRANIAKDLPPLIDAALKCLAAQLRTTDGVHFGKRAVWAAVEVLRLASSLGLTVDLSDTDMHKGTLAPPPVSDGDTVADGDGPVSDTAAAIAHSISASDTFQFSANANQADPGGGNVAGAVG